MFTISWMRGNPSLFLTASLFYTYQPVAVKIYMYLIRSSFSVLEKNRQRKKTYFSKSYVKKNFRIYIYCERARKNIWINFAAYLNKNATVTGQKNYFFSGFYVLAIFGNIIENIYVQWTNLFHWIYKF